MHTEAFFLLKQWCIPHACTKSALGIIVLVSALETNEN